MTKVQVNWGPADKQCSVRLFAVYNTNHKSLYVLARDWRQAMSIACTANHVYDPTPKIAETYSREVHEVTSAAAHQLSAHWDIIQRAIDKRLEGTVRLEDGGISVGDQVFK